MFPTDGRSGNGGTVGWRVRVFVTVVTLVAVALSIPVGYILADTVGATVGRTHQPGAATTPVDAVENYTVHQGETCVDVVPFSGEKSVKAFYDYRTPYPDDEYTNATGETYSSEGTRDLQEPNTSVLFLYADPTGNLSLVFVHGALNETSDGGSVTFNVSNLPTTGTWAVKDDEYDDPSNVDEWSHGDGTASIDWTWGDERTDGGAFSGLGEEFTVTIDPAFNENASLYEQHFDGTVENWTALSNTTEQDESGTATDATNRTHLNFAENVTVTTQDCEDLSTLPVSQADDDTPDSDDSPADDEDEPIDVVVPTEPPDTETPDVNDDTETESETEDDDTETETEEEQDDETETEDEQEVTEDDQTDTDEEETETETEEDETEGDETETEDDESEDDDTETEETEAEDEDQGPEGSAPSVNGWIWDRIGQSDEFDVEWVVTDVDGDLSAVSIELVDGNAVHDEETIDASGASESGTTRLSGGDADGVRLTVTDDDGNEATASYGIGPPSSSEQDTETTDG